MEVGTSELDHSIVKSSQAHFAPLLHIMSQRAVTGSQKLWFYG